METKGEKRYTMWIDKRYYDHLLGVLESFSEGKFDFDERKLNSFNGEKYERITNALTDIRHVSQENISNCMNMLNGIDGGVLWDDALDMNVTGDYKTVYDKYRQLLKHMEEINNGIQNFQETIIENGDIDAKLNLEGLKGIWLNSVTNLNKIMSYFLQNINEITMVLTKVAEGDLTQKITIESNGKVLEVKNTINNMLDELSQFASEVTRVAKEVGTEGMLGGQAKVDGVSGTWLDLTNNVNDMANSLTYQVRNIAEVTTAVAEGDLTQKITVDAKGEVSELKNTINTMVDQLSQFASEVTRVAKEVGTEGMLGGQAKVDGVSGTWLDLTNNVNDMANSLTYQVRNIAEVTTAVAEGDLTQKITVDAKGEVSELKNTINTMVDQLSQFASEVTRVAKEVGTEGMLGGQAKVDGVSGTWLDLTNNVNDMANSLTYQVRNIAEVTTAVAEGDLTQKITVDAKGEVSELKNTINTMVDQLSQFASEVTRVAKEVGTEGMLGGQTKVDGVSGTWLALTNNVNEMANSLTYQVRNIAEVTTAVAEGDLTQKITVDAKGEVSELKNTINTMVDQLSQFASEVTRVAKEVGTEGMLGGQAEVNSASGTWLDLTNNVNDMANSLTYQVRNIAEVTTAVAEGDLTQKITVDAKGEVSELKNTINTMVDQLSQFASEVTRVAKEVGTEGMLGGQAKVDGVSGTWLDLTNNVNDMANSLTYQVRNIAEVTTAVAEGDLTQKITVDAKGEVSELKNTINTMVDQLSQFASEVTRVAKEVGTEGMLGGQAKVDGVSGTWLDLTNNVNDMANSLTYQVRNISEVTKAVADGDLTQKITVDAKGEVLELKNTINTMVDQLSQFTSEVTRVAKEVGTNGNFGTQAKVDNASGTWLDITNDVNIMSKSLAEFDTENENQNWIKDGISILSKEILYKDAVTEQFQIAINQLCHYIHAGMGVIYIYNDATRTLELEASYSYTRVKGEKYSVELGEGIIGQVAYDRKPILVESDKSNQFIKSGTTEYKISSTYTSPLIFKENLVGVIEVATCESFTKLQIEYLESALLVLAGSFYAAIQAKDNKNLEVLSNTDALTGLSNRGYFDKILPQILNYEKRRKGKVAFAIMDIDYFKNFNDKYGHQIGDEVLRSVAGVLKESLNRSGDYCFRIGGEEFAIVFNNIDKQKTIDYAKKIKRAIGQLKIRDERGGYLDNITVSMGLTCKNVSEINNADTLVEETDKLLYRAKETGRNKIIPND